MEIEHRREVKSVVVGDGETISAAVNVEGYAKALLLWPADIAGATATFLGGPAGDERELYDADGEALSAAVVAGEGTVIDSHYLVGSSLKLVLDTAQTGDQTVQVCLLS